MRNKYRNHRNQENYDNWREAAKLTGVSFENDRQQFLENKCLQAEEAVHPNQSSKVYFIIRGISGKSTINTAKLVNTRNGESPADNDELIKEWAAYFKLLLNVRNEERSTEIPPAATDLGICTDNIMLDELRKAINKMKPGKFPGTDFTEMFEIYLRECSSNERRLWPTRCTKGKHQRNIQSNTKALNPFPITGSFLQPLKTTKNRLVF